MTTTPTTSTWTATDQLEFEKLKLEYELQLRMAHNWQTNTTAMPNTIWQTNIKLPFKRITMGQNAMAEVACRPDELNDYYMFGQKPEVGKQYQLVCTGIEEVGGQIVAKFKLL